MKRLVPLFTLFAFAACGKHERAQTTAALLPSVAVRVHAAKSELHTATEEVVGTVRSKQRAVVEANLGYIDALEARWFAAAELAGLAQIEAFP